MPSHAEQVEWFGVYHCISQSLMMRQQVQQFTRKSGKYDRSGRKWWQRFASLNTTRTYMGSQWQTYYNKSRMIAPRGWYRPHLPHCRPLVSQLKAKACELKQFVKQFVKQNETNETNPATTWFTCAIHEPRMNWWNWWQVTGKSGNHGSPNERLWSWSTWRLSPWRLWEIIISVCDFLVKSHQASLVVVVSPPVWTCQKMLIWSRCFPWLHLQFWWTLKKQTASPGIHLLCQTSWNVGA